MLEFDRIELFLTKSLQRSDLQFFPIPLVGTRSSPQKVNKITTWKPGPDQTAPGAIWPEFTLFAHSHSDKVHHILF